MFVSMFSNLYKLSVCNCIFVILYKKRHVAVGKKKKIITNWSTGTVKLSSIHDSELARPMILERAHLYVKHKCFMLFSYTCCVMQKKKKAWWITFKWTRPMWLPQGQTVNKYFKISWIIWHHDWQAQNHTRARGEQIMTIDSLYRWLTRVLPNSDDKTSSLPPGGRLQYTIYIFKFFMVIKNCMSHNFLWLN